MISGTETRMGLDAMGHRTVFLGTDVLLGGAGVVYKGAALLIAWFTLWTWLGRGWTPGKRLLGLRVAALDGRHLSLWRCFNRTGGYGVSAATAGLGFLAARWDPNRQADHDKIVGTVVLREGGTAPAAGDTPPPDPDRSPDDPVAGT